MLKGRLISSWIELFDSCFNYTEYGFSQWCFPDGQVLLDQPSYVPKIFSLIKSEAERQINKKVNNSNKNKNG